MIEVDGLMAAVIPTPNASPSADAPAEFAAAMAVVEGETGQGGTESDVDQQLTADVGEAEAPEEVQLPLGDPSLVTAESLLGADPAVVESPSVLVESIPDPRALDGRDLDFSALVGMTPTPTEDAPPAVGLSLLPTVAADDGPIQTSDVPASVLPEEIGTPTPAPATDSPVAPIELAGAPEPESAAPLAPADANVDPISAAAVVGDAAMAVDAVVADDVVVDPPPTERAVASEPVAASLNASPDLAVITPADLDDEVVPSGVDVPEEQTTASQPLAGVAPAAPTPAAPAPSSAGERLDVAAPELAAAGLEPQATPVTASAPESGAEVATPAATPTVEPSTPNVQPVTANVAGPRADVTVTEVADVAPPPSTSTPETTPTQQVAEALREVRRLADGSHRLSLQLHPEELGAVQLEVAIRDGQLHVRAVAETEAARSALEQNLPELRSDLRDAGVRAGSLEVGPDASGRDRSDSPERGTRTDGSREPEIEEPPTATPDPSTTSGLDIRL